ncbi:MAG: terminase small subunit [Bacillota bacterium]
MEKKETRKKRQKKIIFAEAYALSNGNTSQALREAGYSAKSVAYAQELLKDPEVQEHIAWVQMVRAKETNDLRKAIDAGAAQALDDLVRLRDWARERLEDAEGPLLMLAVKTLREISTYMIDKSIPNPPTRQEITGRDGEPLKVILEESLDEWAQ